MNKRNFARILRTEARDYLLRRYRMLNLSADFVKNGWIVSISHQLPTRMSEHDGTSHEFCQKGNLTLAQVNKVFTAARAIRTFFPNHQIRFEDAKEGVFKFRLFEWAKI